jgi:hypothetical protein
MQPTTKSLTICRPDDWHTHVRDGEILRAVLPHTAKVFGRAIIMPNLKPPVTTTARAAAYREEIRAALPKGADFTPLMTLYLTDSTDAEDLARGHTEGVITAAKLYPAHATTNSEHGVTDVKKIYPVLERMQRIGMPLLVHGEVTDPATDIFDREAIYIDTILKPLRKDFPELKIVMEHITTEEAAAYVTSEGRRGRLAATITPHHLLINRNAIFALTACRSRKGKNTGSRSSRPRPRARRCFFSARIPRRIRARPRKMLAVAPASSARLRLWSFMLMFLMKPGPCRISKLLRATMVRLSMGLNPMRAA